MVNVAVICVPPTTTTLLTVIPAGLTPTEAPLTKLAPVRVTFTAAPRFPLLGDTLDSVGVAVLPVTVNGTVPLVPPLVVTDTLYDVATAVAAMVNVAVICVLLTTEVL